MKVVTTGILAFGVFALTDLRNPHRPPHGLLPPFVALVVVTVGLSFGLNTGYPLNPARDFGPRIWTAIIYGADVFTVGHSFAFVALCVPFVGAVAGAALYEIALGSAHES
jgi:glycerol uptake facilitator-like aquaporin